MSVQAMTAEQAAAEAAAKTTTAPPAAAVTTTTEAKPPTTLEALKAARRATVTDAPKPGEATKTEEPKPGKPSKTVDVKLDEASLAKFTKLNSELQAARAELAKLKPTAEKGTKVDQAAKMIADGKSFDGIIGLVGLEAFNQAVKEVTGAADKKPPESPEAAKLREELEALKKDNASNKEQLAAAAALQREVGVTKIIQEVQTTEKERFPFLSRSGDWVRDALKGADEAYAVANAKCREDNDRDMNDGEKNALLRAALEVAEEDHAKRSKLYAVPEAAKPAPAAKPTPRTVDRTMRTAVTKVGERKKSATLEELKRERRGLA